MAYDLSDICVSPDISIREAVHCIDRNQHGIVLVTDGERHLLGTITDGDVRRAMLAGRSLEAPVSELLARKADSPYPKPVTALVGTEVAALLQLMQERWIRQVPLVDDEGRVVDLVTWYDLLPDQPLPLQAVIMAGGQGMRLRPLTEDLPKPMLPVGDRPLMEHIINQLRDAGIRRVNVTTNYLAEKITDYFGDGSEFGVELSYVTEARPLGTAGGIGLLKRPDEPLLVINGDILTRVDFRAMLDYHREHRAALTVAVRKYEFTVPYGVVESEGGIVRGLVEKPSYSFFVNAGIYLLDAVAHRLIPDGDHMDMTDLIELLLQEGQTVVSFPIREYWLDIGQYADYQRAQEDARNGQFDASATSSSR